MLDKFVELWMLGIGGNMVFQNTESNHKLNGDTRTLPRESEGNPELQDQPILRILGY